MLKILDINDNALEVEVIRYFKLNNKNYFMYSLNEVDEQSYVKLYAVRVNDNLQGEKIVDDAEWETVKAEIKVIIKGNKEGNLVVEDLNFEELKNFKLSETRAFKLSSQLVELLKANKKEFVVESSFDVSSVLEEMKTNSFGVELNTMAKEEEKKEEFVADYSFETEEETPLPVVEPVVAPVVEPVAEPVVIPVVEPTVETTFEQVIEPQPSTTQFFEDLGMPVIPEVAEEKKEEFVADYSFETEELPVAPVTKLEEPEMPAETEVKEDYKLLYEEEKELTEVLKAEIAELRGKLSQITQILSQ